MSKQSFDAFKSQVTADPTLRQEMTDALSAGGTKKTASVDEVVAFAKTRGYEFSPSEVQANIELTEGQLEAGAGGAAVDYGGVSGGQYKEIEISSFSWGVSNPVLKR